MEIERSLRLTGKNDQIIRESNFAPALRPNHSHIVRWEQLNDHTVVIGIPAEGRCRVILTITHELLCEVLAIESSFATAEMRLKLQAVGIEPSSRGTDTRWKNLDGKNTNSTN
jgi:hypothetical protein